MKKLTIALSLFVLALNTLSARADDSALRSNPDFYRLSPLTIKEVVPTAEELYSDYLAPAAITPAPVFQTIDWATLNLIGQKIIQIIQAGKPVVNVKRDAVAVVPQGITAWSQLSGWQAPVTKVYSVTAKNYLGLTVVDLRLKVSANYGGGIDGRGKYLANLVVVPSSIYLLWGFSLDVWSEHQDPVNVGSSASPVAGLGFDLRFRYGSPLNETQGSQDYFVSGTGEIRENQ
jgi:hypothetical protein